MKFLTVQLPPFSRHLIPLRSKYSSQNPVLNPINIYKLQYLFMFFALCRTLVTRVSAKMLSTFMIGVGGDRIILRPQMDILCQSFMIIAIRDGC
jgi:hypothetical protein